MIVGPHAFAFFPGSVATQSYEDYVLQDGPYAFYLLNERSTSDVAADEGPNGISADYVGDISLERPTVLPTGTSALFNGGDATIQATAPYLPDSPPGFTIEAWVKTTDLSSLMYLYGVGETALPIDFGIDGGQLRLRINESEGSGDTPPSITSDSWHHVAVTVVNDGSTDNVVYYLDGEAQATRTYTETLGDVSGESAFYIGARTTIGDQQYSGYLDAPATFDYALTPDQVDSHYWAGQG